MDYEFKKLSDVDVVAEPAESANVLIEENGVIKKAPKTAVGGSGGGTFVIVGTPTDESISMTALTKMNIDKTFEEILNAFNERQQIVLKFDYYGTINLMPLQNCYTSGGIIDSFVFNTTLFSPESCTVHVLLASISETMVGYQEVEYNTNEIQRV